mgnify:CR=1 FL=1
MRPLCALVLDRIGPRHHRKQVFEWIRLMRYCHRRDKVLLEIGRNGSLYLFDFWYLRFEFGTGCLVKKKDPCARTYSVTYGFDL